MSWIRTEIFVLVLKIRFSSHLMPTFLTDNGCQTSLERFTDPKRKAFFGKCIVVLKGKGTLKAQAPDLKEAMLKF